MTDDNATDDPPRAAVALAELLDSLMLEPLGPHRWRASAPARRRLRLFGGHVLAQAVMAAAADADRPELAVRSLHAQFVRAGTAGVPVELAVGSLSDSRTSAVRHVQVFQEGRSLIDATIRFHTVADGDRRHFQQPPAVADPSQLPDFPTRMRARGGPSSDWQEGFIPVDVRYDGDPGVDRQTTWFRTPVEIGDDPVLHAAIVTYASDMTLIGVAPESLGTHWWSPGVELASLDHAIWFHEQVLADAWTAYEQRAVITGAERALVQGSMFAPDGRLLATVMQDGVMRVP